MCLSGRVHQARGELVHARDMYGVLVASALQRALLAQWLAPSLIGHSDRRSKYVSINYKALLRNAITSITQAQLSDSRRGERYDDA